MKFSFGRFRHFTCVCTVQEYILKVLCWRLTFLWLASYNSEAVLHICFYPCAVQKVLGELYRFLSDGSFTGEPSDELLKLT